MVPEIAKDTLSQEQILIFMFHLSAHAGWDKQGPRVWFFRRGTRVWAAANDKCIAVFLSIFKKKLGAALEKL